MAQDKKKERSGYLVPGLLAGAGAGTLAATVPLGLAREQGTLPREYFPMVVEGLKRIDEATARNRGEGLGEFVIASGDALRNKVLGDHTGLDVIAAARRADLPLHRFLRSTPGMNLAWGEDWDSHRGILSAAGVPFKVDDHYKSLVQGPVSGLRHIAGNETALEPTGYDAYAKSPLMQLRRDTALNSIIPGLHLLPENLQARVLNQMNHADLLPKPDAVPSDDPSQQRVSNTNIANRTLATEWLTALNRNLTGDDRVRNPGAQVSLDIDKGLQAAYSELNPGKPLPQDFASLPLEEQASLVRHFAKSPAGAETEHSLRGRGYDYTKVLGAYTNPFRYLAQPMAYASEYWPWLAGAGALAAGAGGYGLYNAFRNNQESDKEDDEEKKKTEETKTAMIKQAADPVSETKTLSDVIKQTAGTAWDSVKKLEAPTWAALNAPTERFKANAGNDAITKGIEQFRNNNPWVDWAAGGLGVGAAAGLASGLIRRKRNKHRAIGDALTMGLLGGLATGAGRYLGGEVLNMGGDVNKPQDPNTGKYTISKDLKVSPYSFESDPSTWDANTDKRLKMTEDQLLRGPKAVASMFAPTGAPNIDPDVKAYVDRFGIPINDVVKLPPDFQTNLDALQKEMAKPHPNRSPEAIAQYKARISLGLRDVQKQVHAEDLQGKTYQSLTDAPLAHHALNRRLIARDALAGLTPDYLDKYDALDLFAKPKQPNTLLPALTGPINAGANFLGINLPDMPEKFNPDSYVGGHSSVQNAAAKGTGLSLGIAGIAQMAPRTIEALNILGNPEGALKTVVYGNPTSDELEKRWNALGGASEKARFVKSLNSYDPDLTPMNALNPDAQGKTRLQHALANAVEHRLPLNANTLTDKVWRKLELAAAKNPSSWVELNNALNGPGGATIIIPPADRAAVLQRILDDKSVDDVKKALIRAEIANAVNAPPIARDQVMRFATGHGTAGHIVRNTNENLAPVATPKGLRATHRVDSKGVVRSASPINPWLRWLASLGLGFTPTVGVQQRNAAYERAAGPLLTPEARQAAINARAAASQQQQK